MKSVKGTETEKNLLKAFAGESQARNRYTYFASRARKDGFVQIADIFEKPRIRRRSMRNVSSSFLRAANWRSRRLFPPA